MAEVTYTTPGAITIEREHRVPLDHARSGGPSITVFNFDGAASRDYNLSSCVVVKLA